MCATCGCSDDGAVRIFDLRNDVPDGHDVVTSREHQDAGTSGQSHIHSAHPHNEHAHDEHAHDEHAHDEHAHDRPTRAGTEMMVLEQRVLAKNDALAQHNRAWLQTHGVAAINLMSSPGSGKTTLLERTVRELMTTTAVWVIEGDQETTFDAERIKAAGASVLQINTGSGCHLDASMMKRALRTLDPSDGIVLIENVGNLVCPALFDLGEAARAVIMSVTEGADKPLKYPHIFASATVVVLNKVDLLPYVDFDVARFEHDVALINPKAAVLPISATRGQGLDMWYRWIRDRRV